MADSPDGFVWAYARTTGERRRVPANRLTHPRLRKFWRKTAPPTTPQAPEPEETPPTDAPDGHDQKEK